MSNHCPHCNTPNPQGGRFCVHCRAALSQTTMLRQQTRVVSTGAPPPRPLELDEKTILKQVTHILGPSSGAAVNSVHPLAGLPGLPGIPADVQPEDTILLIDVSGSMDWAFERHITKLKAAQDAAIACADEKARIDQNDRMAVVAFSVESWIKLPLSSLKDNHRQITRAINQLRIAGGTDIDAGLRMAESALDWHKRRVVRRIVLLTDGQGGEPLNTARRLHNNGVVIDVVGIGKDSSEVNEELLREVASVVGGQSRYRFIRDPQALTQHYTWVAQKTQIR